MKKIFSFLVLLSLFSCTTTLVSQRKPFQKENFKIGKYHQFKTENKEYYGKIDSISQEKVYLSYKSNPKEVVEISQIQKAKKYSVGKTLAYPIIGYAVLATTAIIILTQGISE
ncbi:hypothetical protein [Frigoriflavimonas asaccharolytica]|uniref:Lipoprotein n=1 Tax=Frigoriflavimonas asaccharolytica TaxID=2735899 RepID=A0A8J8G401_9FLAO|nr:hypothetical protein [Frigoriflavimonas asaccharolytica]NRS91048.1 hypothetical protein [Frigoriflavimonas asaccharolytica]